MADGRGETASTAGPWVTREVRNALAGGVAGACQRMASAPLDVIKIRFEVQIEPTTASHRAKYGRGVWHALRTIVREEGVAGLWRGNVPGLAMVVPYGAAQFLVYQSLKDVAGREGIFGGGFGGGAGGTFASEMVCGGTAGAVATLVTYPLDLLRTRLAAQGEPKAYRTMREAAWAVHRAAGVSGLYTGIRPSLVEIVPYMALNFAVYNLARDQFLERRRRQRCDVSCVDPLQEGQSVSERGAGTGNGTGGRILSENDGVLAPVENLACGWVSGLVSKTAVHPLDVVKKRFQVAGMHRSESYGMPIAREVYREGITSCMLHIVRTEGVRGIYKGLFPSLLKAAPSAAVTFTVYDRVRRWLDALDP